MIELQNEDGIKADDHHRTIVLKYMPDGTISVDCENDPTLLEKYADQINAIIEQNRRPLLRPFPSLAGAMKPARYGPCIGCGNPAKNQHCFKCQQKRAA